VHDLLLSDVYRSAATVFNHFNGEREDMRGMITEGDKAFKAARKKRPETEARADVNPGDKMAIESVG
jgi:hypothetical protein